MTTMRERLIAAAERTNFVECGSYEVNNWPEVIDAILAELREPDERAVSAGEVGAALRADWDEEFASPLMIRAAFTAMIDHVRAGK